MTLAKPKATANKTSIAQASLCDHHLRLSKYFIVQETAATAYLSVTSVTKKYNCNPEMPERKNSCQGMSHTGSGHPEGWEPLCFLLGTFLSYC
jgi:hypothetical protein